MNIPETHLSFESYIDRDQNGYLLMFKPPDGYLVEKIQAGPQTLAPVHQQSQNAQTSWTAWSIPTSGIGNMDVQLKKKSGEISVLNLRQGAKDFPKPFYHVGLKLSADTIGWGVRVTARFTVLQSSRSHQEVSLPADFLAMRFVLKSLSRSKVFRPVHTMLPLLLNTVHKISNHVTEVDKRHEHSSLKVSPADTERAYLQKIQADDQLIFVHEKLAEILDAMRRVRAEGATAITAANLATEGRYQRVAIQKWQAAFTTLVAQKLTWPWCAESGFLQNNKSVELAPLTLSEGDELVLSEIPRNIRVTLILENTSQGDAHLTKAVLQGGVLVLLDESGAALKPDVPTDAELPPDDWEDRVSEALARTDVDPNDDGLIQDIAFLSALPPIPKKLLQTVQIASVENLAQNKDTPLRALKVWEIAPLTDLLSERFLGHLSNHISLSTTPSSETFSFFKALDDNLSSDPRYVEILSKAFLSFGLDLRADHEETAFALWFLLVALLPGNEAFLRHSSNNDFKASLIEARTLLELDETPRLVKP